MSKNFNSYFPAKLKFEPEDNTLSTQVDKPGFRGLCVSYIWFFKPDAPNLFVKLPLTFFKKNYNKFIFK